VGVREIFSFRFLDGWDGGIDVEYGGDFGTDRCLTSGAEEWRKWKFHGILSGTIAFVRSVMMGGHEQLEWIQVQGIYDYGLQLSHCS
jgi:hypothetical protein